MARMSRSRGILIVSLVYLWPIIPAVCDTAPLMGDGEIGLKNCTSVDLTLNFSREKGDQGLDFVLRGGQNTLLRYCPPRCLASIATSGRGLFELNVEPTSRYVVDFGTDGIGRFWRIRKVSDNKQC
jgi:hypothetical protein